MNNPWHEAINLVPHRPPMLFIDFVRVLGRGKAEAKTTVKANWIIIDQRNKLLGLSFFEMMAQSYAAMASLCLQAAGKEGGGVGFLVALKRFTVHHTANVGEELVIRVGTKAAMGPFAVVDGEVFRDNTLLAAGQIKVFSPSLQDISNEI